MPAMTRGEAVLLDSLKAMGFEHVTTWSLLCLESALRQWSSIGARNRAIDRLRHDLFAASLDGCHVFAQWENAEWTASRSNRNFRRELNGVLP